MQILKKTAIDFLGKRLIGAAASTVLIAGGIVSLVVSGPRLGIDFAGGSQFVVRFADMPALADIRSALQAEGLAAVIQEFEADSNEVLVRTPGTAEGEDIDVAVVAVNAGLARLTGAGGDDRLDINTAGPEEIVSLLLEVNPRELDLVADPDAARAVYRAALGPLLAARSGEGVLADWSSVAGVDEDIMAILQELGRLGGYRIVNSDSVGPQVGQDLRNQTIQAIIWALVGMLAYISYRFEFKFGVAAVVALVHDVMVTLGAFSLTGRELNLPVVAAFLTIVGYSLNDTVVVFDRIRENNAVLRKLSLYDRVNASLNQTLSRTLLTSVTTLIVVLSLFLYGGPVINDFAFALLVGVLIGTYSSLFVAAPIVYVWQDRDAAKRR